MIRSIRLPLVLVLPVLLAACDSETDVSTENDDREASGEVLEGSIRDAMLPVGEVRSQAPRRALVPVAPASEEGEGEAAGSTEVEAGVDATPATVQPPATTTE